MAGQDAEALKEIFDRLRETEAQTREQNTRISALCDRLDNFTVVTDKFFELEDKRHQSDEQRFKTLCEHEKRLSDAAAAREEKMWKVIVLFAGALIAATVGPKAVTEVYKAYKGGGGPTVSYYSPALPMQQQDFGSHFGRREPVKS